MRLIGTLEDEGQARTFSRFLLQKGIPHHFEAKKDTDWGSATYGLTRFHLWIEDENHLKDTLNWFHQFTENPQDPLFAPQRVSPPPIPSASQAAPASPSRTRSSWDQKPMGWITSFFLAACCFLFFLSQLLMPAIQIPEKYAGLVLFTSPVEKALLFDYPKFYELINRFLKLYGYQELEHPNELPPEGQKLLQQINHTPYWPGYYSLLLKGGWQAVQKGLSDYPAFEKIREGQVWRLFTPCLLHADLFHIFFNMLWLIVLGKQIEQRLSPGRYLLFILIIGVFSNIVQYLMSGPNFIGFSGILCGMLAFIWIRQKTAAWEGYQLDKMTLVFMLLFIMSMAAIQLFSFFMEKTFSLAFAPNIANGAHLAGGLMGFFLGRLNFFSWRHQ